MIRSEEDLRRAEQEIEKLWGAEEGTPEFDRAQVLITLADAWERQHHPVQPVTALEAIHFRMEQLGLTRKDLVPYLGTRARVSEVLNGRRSLTLPMIRKLHEGLQIPAESLIG